MSCRQHDEPDDDGPFRPDDELFPAPGVEPRDAGNEDGPDPIWSAAKFCAAVFLVVIAATAIVAAVQQ